MCFETHWMDFAAGGLVGMVGMAIYDILLAWWIDR